jgi:hypothetical protein
MAVNEHDTDVAGAEERRIAALYRQSATEEPPSRLDALIRSAAHRPFQSAVPAERAPWWQVWRLPLALACVAVLSVSVVTLIQRDGGDPLMLEPPASPPVSAQPPLPPADVAADAPAKAQAQAEAQSQPTKPPRPDNIANERSARGVDPGPNAGPPAQVRGQSAGPELRESPSREPAARDLAEREARRFKPEEEAARRATEGVTSREQDAALASQRAAVTEQQAAPPLASPVPKPAAPAATAAPPPSPRAFAKAPVDAATASASAAKRLDQPGAPGAVPPAIAALLAELDGRPPARWIERVLELRRENRREDADAVLAEFKRRYPDEPLPPSVR